MFYCEPCRVEKSWPKGTVTSHGRCEMCEGSRSCYDVPSRDLPKSKPEGETLVSYCVTCRTKTDWPNQGLKPSKGICDKCGDPGLCYILPEKYLHEPEGETVESDPERMRRRAAEKICPTARPSSEEQLAGAAEMLEHRDKLALLRKEKAELEDTIRAVDAKYREAHDALANTGRGNGDSEAFQVGNRVVTVLGQPSGQPSIIRVMSLTAPPPVLSTSPPAQV